MTATAPKPMRVELNWRLKSPTVAIGPTPRTILQVQAVRRQVKIVTVRLDYPDFPTGGIAEAFLVRQPRCVGLRTLGCMREGDAVCAGRAGFPAGSLGDWLQHNRNEWPHDFWQHLGPVTATDEYVVLERGECLGVVVSCNVAAACRASIGGL
jgi:hypothetical protein